MSISSYQPKQLYTGTGSLSSYTFNFKITYNTQLLIVVMNTSGVEVQRVRGDDVTFLSSVVINSNGGTINLQSNLPSGYKLFILSADDAPTQPYEFSNKSSFSLKRIENMADYIVSQIQRLAFLGQRSVKLHESEDETAFDLNLPLDAASNPDAILQINDTGDGFKFGPSLTSIIAASQSLPNGGDIGAALVKNSAADQDVAWDDFIIQGYSNRFGVNWSSAGLRDTIMQILQIVYAAPAIASFTGTSTGLREKGNPLASVTLSVNVTKKTNNIARIRFLVGGVPFQDDMPPSNIGSGITNAVYSTPFSDTTVFTAEVTDETTVDGGPSTVSANLTYTFVYPYYNGCAAPGQTPAQVGTLTKSIIASTATLNKSFTSANGDVYYFAYPASYGNLVSILDENGFETFSAWTKTTANITGLDGNPVSYNIYESNNPVVAGSTNFTFKR